MIRQGRALPEHACGAAGSRIIRIAEVSPELRRPSTNADVWLPEGRLNPLYGEHAAICSTCWMVYLAPIDRWCRSLVDPASYSVPLTEAIRRFPIAPGELPRSTLMYNQLYGRGVYTESVGYWYERADGVREQLEAYAAEWGLSLDFEPGPPGRSFQVLVSASQTRRVHSPASRAAVTQ